MKRALLAFACAALALSTTPLAWAQEPAAPARWVTLGTRGGPVASATRSQPANLLLVGGHRYLIDAGDGAVEQLAKAGIAANQLDAVFLSHLHFDHTAGLAAVLGLRWQTNATGVLTVYGPPGTAELVQGLVASMKPGTTAGYGIPGAPSADPGQQVRVVELRNGADFERDGMRVRAVKNTHYSFVPGSDLDKHFESLSLRFDLPGRSIVYTGDTGPSPAVSALAQGADLLVAEMMDVDDTIAKVRQLSPNLPPPAVEAMQQHLRTHHLRPDDVGELASEAKVGAVVVTHFVGKEPGEQGHLEYLRQIARKYAGPAVIANDLEAF